MDAMWAESDCRTPMICFLSMGSDPTDNIERLAKSKGIRTYSYDCGDLLLEMFLSMNDGYQFNSWCSLYFKAICSQD